MGLSILIVHVVITSVKALTTLLRCYPQWYSAVRVISLLLRLLVIGFVSVFSCCLHSEKGQNGTPSSVSLLHALINVILSCLFSLISKGGL